MKELMIFERDEIVSPYKVKTSYPVGPRSDGMLTLEMFLFSDVWQFGTTVLEHLNSIILHTIEGCAFNVTSIDGLLGDMLALNFHVIENINSLIIPSKELLNIVRTWIELTEKKVLYIVLKHDKDKWTIDGGNNAEELLDQS